MWPFFRSWNYFRWCVSIVFQWLSGVQSWTQTQSVWKFSELYHSWSQSMSRFHWQPMWIYHCCCGGGASLALSLCVFPIHLGSGVGDRPCIGIQHRALAGSVRSRLVCFRQTSRQASEQDERARSRQLETSASVHGPV